LIYFQGLDASQQNTDPEHAPARTNVLFANETDERLDCCVNDAWQGAVDPFRQLVVRMDAGQVWLKATRASRAWGPISVNLARDANFTWSITAP